MANGYQPLPSDPYAQLKTDMEAIRRRLDELERPSGIQTLATFAGESFGAPNLLDVTTAVTVSSVEALIGDTLEVPQPGRSVYAFVTCYADIKTRLRGTGGSITVSLDVKDNGGSTLAIASSFTFTHTAADDVVLNIPMVASGVVTIGNTVAHSLQSQIIYSITPGTTDGRLQITTTRMAVQQIAFV